MTVSEKLAHGFVGFFLWVFDAGILRSEMIVEIVLHLAFILGVMKLASNEFVCHRDGFVGLQLLCAKDWGS